VTIGVIARHATRKSGRQTTFPNFGDFVLSVRSSHPHARNEVKEGMVGR
jgi:hypothetical protein